MSDFASLYGRQGQKADGDPQVAELLQRTTENQYQTMTAFAEIVNQAQADHPWLADISVMAVAHGKWLATMLWQMATGYLDGVAIAFADKGQLPPAVYTECDSLCDLAAASTLETIQLQSKMAQGAKPAKVNGASLPALPSNGGGFAGVWRALEAVYLQVRDDFRVFDGLAMPKSMAAVQQALKQEYQPQADMFFYLQTSWRSAASAENRTDIIQQAQPIAQTLFRIGQQLWAPSLLGQVYQTALNYKPSLDELELGFDPWILCDHELRSKHEKDPKAIQQLTDFWLSNPDPEATRQIQQQIETAHQQRQIRYVDGGALPVFPWQSRWLAHRSVTLDGTSFQPGDYLAIYTAPKGDGSFINAIRKAGRLRLKLKHVG